MEAFWIGAGALRTKVAVRDFEPRPGDALVTSHVGVICAELEISSSYLTFTTMAFVPPPNNAGVAPPPFPQNPPTLGDVTNTKEYSERLSLSKRKKFRSPQLAQLMTVYTIGLQTPGATATDDEIGAAERYHHDIVMTNTVMGPAPPQWLVQLMGAGQPIWLGNLIGNVAQIQADMQAGFANVNQMQQTCKHSMSAIICAS